MRRRAIATVAAVCLLAALTAGCSLFRDDFPSRDCSDNLDCFRAQGEVCNPQTKQCEVPPDAAPTPDARPTPDAAPPADADTTPDAEPAPDAEPTPDADLSPDAA